MMKFGSKLKIDIQRDITVSYLQSQKIGQWTFGNKMDRLTERIKGSY